jgi:EAL and modified HD-GYP domain-containing signal transduction protein
MEIHIARQPIYDKNLKVFAYELLYRSNAEADSYTGNPDPDAATISVIIDAFLSIGIETVTNNVPGFINFTGNLLESGIAKLLPREYLGIEILESVAPSAQILAACRELRDAGYIIVLDDYSHDNSSRRFIRYADIIKMDFLESTDEQLRLIVETHKSSGLKFIAEKVETEADYLKAVQYGYDYFQGYYFNRPSLVRGKDILPRQVSALKVFNLLQDSACDIGDLVAVIGADPGMAYKLLKLANSVVYGGRNRITNLTSAIVRIGLKELQTWIVYLMMHGTNKDKPDELIRQSMLRAWAAEEICKAKALNGPPSDFSLMGLFSLMDVIMDTPFDVIVSHIKISDDVTSALIDPGDDAYGATIRVIRSYDDADWDGAKRAGSLIGMSLEEYQDIYLLAIKKCDSVCNEMLSE